MEVITFMLLVTWGSIDTCILDRWLKGFIRRMELLSLLYKWEYLEERYLGLSVYDAKFYYGYFCCWERVSCLRIWCNSSWDKNFKYI